MAKLSDFHRIPWRQALIRDLMLSTADRFEKARAEITQARSLISFIDRYGAATGKERIEIGYEFARGKLPPGVEVTRELAAKPAVIIFGLVGEAAYVNTQMHRLLPQENSTELVKRMMAPLLPIWSDVFEHIDRTNSASLRRLFWSKTDKPYTEEEVQSILIRHRESVQAGIDLADTLLEQDIEAWRQTMRTFSFTAEDQKDPAVRSMILLMGPTKQAPPPAAPVITGPGKLSASRKDWIFPDGRQVKLPWGSEPAERFEELSAKNIGDVIHLNPEDYRLNSLTKRVNDNCVAVGADWMVRQHGHGLRKVTVQEWTESRPPPAKKRQTKARRRT